MSSDRPPRRSQFEAFSLACERFADELMKTDNADAALIAKSFIEAKAQYAAWLSDPRSKITRSMLVSGMKQGLRDTPIVLRGFPSAVRHQLMAAYRQILEEEVPGFLAFEREKLARIVRRGRVRNEDEWHLLRHRVDEIEGHREHQDELRILYGLLDGYESGAGPPG